MGLSTYQPRRTLLNWPKDVLELADHLKIQQFPVLGISGGSPCVLACAKEIPRSRLLAASIISGVYPAKFGTEGMLLPIKILFFFLPDRGCRRF
jgi:pimeloyl-ACP methyl ester carboxylesterase